MTFSRHSPRLSSFVLSWIFFDTLSFKVQSFYVGSFEVWSFSFEVGSLEVGLFEVRSVNRVEYEAKYQAGTVFKSCPPVPNLNTPRSRIRLGPRSNWLPPSNALIFDNRPVKDTGRYTYISSSR